MRVIIYPYKFYSASARLIVKALNGICVRNVGRYRMRQGDIIINWGSTMFPTWGHVDLNQPQAVGNAVNKIMALQTMAAAGVRTVEHTTSSDTACQWLAWGHSVYARTLTRASAGRGIHVVKPGDSLPRAPLYTKGINSEHEYRLHIFCGRVIDYTKKIKLLQSGANSNSLIKSHGNGWTFARNVERRRSIETEAVKAVHSLGLDFGAVDVIVNPDDKNRPYVLEVNTACGLSDGGRTLQSYANAILEYANQAR